MSQPGAGTSSPHFPLPAGYTPPPDARRDLGAFIVTNFLQHHEDVAYQYEQFLTNNRAALLDLHADLSSNHVAALAFYSAEVDTGYRALNTALARRDRLDDASMAWLYYLVQAYNLLPKVAEPVLFRGVNALLTQKSGTLYTKGKHVYYTGVTSTSKTHGVMENFAARGGQGSTLLLIEGCACAVSMSEFSLLAHEDEYLLPPNAHFVVKMALPSDEAASAITLATGTTPTTEVDLVTLTHVAADPRDSVLAPVTGALGSSSRPAPHPDPQLQQRIDQLCQERADDVKVIERLKGEVAAKEKEMSTSQKRIIELQATLEAERSRVAALSTDLMSRSVSSVARQRTDSTASSPRTSPLTPNKVQLKTHMGVQSKQISGSITKVALGSLMGSGCVPKFIALDNDYQSLIVADGGNNRIAVLNPRFDDKNAPCQLIKTFAMPSPNGIVCLGDGRWVVSSGVTKSLFVLNPVTEQVEEFTEDALVAPMGLAHMRNGNVAVADRGGHQICIVDPWAVTLAKTIGDGEGSGPQQFSRPHGVAALRDGTLAVADTGNNRVQVVDPATGTVVRCIPVGMHSPYDVAELGNGMLAVTDTNHHHLLVYDPHTGALISSIYKSVNLSHPRGLAAMPDGAVAVAHDGGIAFVV